MLASHFMGEDICEWSLKEKWYTGNHKLLAITSQPMKQEMYQVQSNMPKLKANKEETKEYES